MDQVVDRVVFGWFGFVAEQLAADHLRTQMGELNPQGHTKNVFSFRSTWVIFLSCLTFEVVVATAPFFDKHVKSMFDDSSNEMM